VIKNNSVFLPILTLLFLAACKPQKTFTKENQLSINSDSETIRLKMLYSHTFWKTIKVEGLANWYVENETPQIYRQQLWIVLPTKARIISGNPDNNPDYVWISDGENIMENGQLSVLPPYVNEPFSPPEVIGDHIYRYPLSMVMVSPFADEIFSSGFAQRGGKYVPIKEEIIASRKSLVVDWTEGTSNERFWIDIDTGVILRDQVYIDKERTKLNHDIVITYIKYDMAISPNYFSFIMPDQMRFEEMSK
jgi:outer membrane lipoprotein-sorting protein